MNSNTSFLSLLQHGSVKLFRSSNDVDLFSPFYFTSFNICQQLVQTHYRSFCVQPSFFASRLFQYFSQLQSTGYLVIPPEIVVSYLPSAILDQLKCYKSFLLSTIDHTSKLTFHKPLESFYNDILADLLLSIGLFDVFNSIFSSEGAEICGGQLFVARRSHSLIQPEDSAYFWHRDSVGRRFKIWLVLHASELSPTTNIISSSNYQDPIPRQWEMLRANKDFITNNGKELTTLISSNPNFVSLSHPPFSLVVVDTNSIHRGDYDSLECSTEPIDTSRIFLEMSVRGKRSGSIFDHFKKDIEADRDLLISERHHPICSKANLVS